MRVGLVVNDLAGELPRYTTTVLGMALAARGHEVRYITLEGWIHRPDDELVVKAHAVPDGPHDSEEEWLDALRESDREPRRESLSAYDVILLRSDPAREAGERRWAAAAGIVFGQLAVQSGALVLNDPFGLSHALNKLYFQSFPAKVRPKTLVTRDPDDVRDFYDTLGGRMVIKPLEGSGGQSVFLVDEEEEANLAQMIEAVLRDGYLVAQEYVPAGSEGDLRLFLMNGRPLVKDGTHAALYREAPADDLRSNLHAGGTAKPGAVGEEALRVAELVRPRLVTDGMYLVGLDIAGGKLLEVNVFSPGGLHSIERFEEMDFAGEIVRDLERKVEIREQSGHLSNREIACL